MARSSVLHADGSEYEGFLYAFIGEDRNGSMVTVLSAFARLGLDPWKEASELAGVSEGAALTRLGVLLSKFNDVPALSDENETISRKLVSLLPARARHVPPQAGTLNSGAGFGGAVTVLGIATILFTLARLLFPGASGLGD